MGLLLQWVRRAPPGDKQFVDSVFFKMIFNQHPNSEDLKCFLFRVKSKGYNLQIMNLLWNILLSIFSIGLLSPQVDGLAGISVRSVADRKILDTFITIGFFSSCHGNESASSNPFHQMARETQKQSIGSLEYNKNYNLRFFDVCNDTDYLVQLMSDLFLEKTYYLDSDGGAVLKEQNIILITAYVTDTMSTLIERIVEPLHPLIARLCLPRNCDYRYPYFNVQDYMLQLSNFLDHFRMYDVMFINLIDRNGRTPYQKYVNATYELLKETEKYCLKRKTYDLHNMYGYRHNKLDVLLDQELFPLVLSKEAGNSITVVFGQVSTCNLVHRV